MAITTSVVDYLKSTGQDSSFAARAALAKKNGISNYTGTATQNTQLLGALSKQKSPAPASAPAPTSSPLPTSAPTADKSPVKTATNTVKGYDVNNNNAVVWVRPGVYTPGVSATPPSTAPTSSPSVATNTDKSPVRTATNTVKGYDVNNNNAVVWVKPGVYVPGVSATLPSSAPAPVVDPQVAEDQKYTEAAAKNPQIATLAKGGSSIDEIINGLSTGDLTGVVDWQGQPFSSADQQAALSKAMEDNKLYYEALQEKDKATAESALAQKTADYQDYLITSGQAFEADKTKSDQSAADSGVLFSGGRVQREKNLERAYLQDQNTKLGTVGRDIGTTARDFQYKYGNDAASGLSKYYNLGSNSFNPNVATGGVTKNGLSSVYNPATYNFQGTMNTERKANANTRAAGYLWNKGNKLLASGYNNQY